MDIKEIEKKLKAPFAAKDIEWRVQSAGERDGKPALRTGVGALRGGNTIGYDDQAAQRIELHGFDNRAAQLIMPTSE